LQKFGCKLQNLVSKPTIIAKVLVFPKVVPQNFKCILIKIQGVKSAQNMIRDKIHILACSGPHFPLSLKPTFVKHSMLIGYARISKSDGSQVMNLQYDALAGAGVSADHIYEDVASGKRDDRPGLSACLKALRQGDTVVVWKLDRLGRDLRHLVNTVQELSDRGIGLKVLAGQGADIDTTTANGKLIFGIFAALAEFERELIRERTKAGLKAARLRGRKGGRKFALTKAQVCFAQSCMGKNETIVSQLCGELGITRATLYRYVGPDGRLREYGRRVLGKEP
jgi:DNA invertase Pin-like site-specific DNA recombinase